MSTLKVVNINNTESGKVSGDNVINRLEAALAAAKDGHISNVVILCSMNDGSVMDCWANGGDPFLIVGGLESIKREFMDACIEGR